MGPLKYSFSDDWLQIAFWCYRASIQKYGVAFVPCPKQIQPSQSSDATAKDRIIYLPSFERGFMVERAIVEERRQYVGRCRLLLAIGAVPYIALMPVIFTELPSPIGIFAMFILAVFLLVVVSKLTFLPWERRARKGTPIELPGQVAYEFESMVRRARNRTWRKTAGKQLASSAAEFIAELAGGKIVGKVVELAVDASVKKISERKQQREESPRVP